MLPLLNVSLPANAGMVFRELAKIAAFDYIEISDFVDEFLELEPTDPVNNKLETVGIETKQFINNVGTFVFFLCCYYLALVLYFMTSLVGLKFKKVRKPKKWLGAKLLWNKLISAIFESVLFVAFAGLIKLKYSLTFESEGEQF